MGIASRPLRGSTQRSGMQALSLPIIVSKLAFHLSRDLAGQCFACATLVSKAPSHSAGDFERNRQSDLPELELEIGTTRARCSMIFHPFASWHEVQMRCGCVWLCCVVCFSCAFVCLHVFG